MAEQKLAAPTKEVVSTSNEDLPPHDSLPDRLALANERLENAVIFDPNQFTQLITQSLVATVGSELSHRREQQLQGDSQLALGDKQKKRRIGVRFDGETIRLLAAHEGTTNLEPSVAALDPNGSGLEIGRAELQRLVERILDDLKLQQPLATLPRGTVARAVAQDLEPRFIGEAGNQLARFIGETVEGKLSERQEGDPPWAQAGISEADWHRLQPVAEGMAVELVGLSAGERTATLEALRAARVPEVEQLLSVVRVEVTRLERALPDIEAKAREDKQLEGLLREIATAPDRDRTLTQIAQSVRGQKSVYGGLFAARLERCFHEREERRALNARAFEVYLAHAVDPPATRWRSFQEAMVGDARKAGLGSAELYDQVERESRYLLRRVSEELLAGRTDGPARVVEELSGLHPTDSRELTERKVKAAFDLLPALLAKPLLSGADTQGLLQRLGRHLPPANYRALLSALKTGDLSGEECAEVAPHLVGIIEREGHLLSAAMKSALRSGNREVMTALVRKALVQDAPAKAYLSLVTELSGVGGLPLHAVYADVQRVLPGRVSAALPGASPETIDEVTRSLVRHVEALRVEDLLPTIGIDLALHPIAGAERLRTHLALLRLEHPTLAISDEELTKRLEVERQRALSRVAPLSERAQVELRFGVQTRAVQMTHAAGTVESSLQTALELAKDLHCTPDTLAPWLGRPEEVAALLQRTALADNHFDRQAARDEVLVVSRDSENLSTSQRRAVVELTRLAEELSRPNYSPLSPHYATEGLEKVRSAYRELGVSGAELDRRSTRFAYGVQLRQAERVIEESERNAVRAGDHYFDPTTKSLQIPVARKADRWIQRGCRSADLPVFLREQYQLLGYAGGELEARVDAAVVRVDQAYEGQRKAAQAPVLAQIRTLLQSGPVAALRFTGDERMIEARPERAPRALSLLRFELLKRLSPDWKKESGAEEGNPPDLKVRELLEKALAGNELLQILENPAALERTLRVIDFQRASFVLGEGSVPYSDSVMRVLAGALPEDEAERLLVEAQAFEGLEYSAALMGRKEAEAEEQRLREESAARWYAVSRVLGAPAKGLTFGLWDPANDGIRLNSWLQGNDSRVTQHLVSRAEGLYGNLSGGWYWISHGAELVGEVGGSLVTMGGTAKLLSTPVKGLLQLTGRSAVAAEYGAFAVSGGAYAAMTAPAGQRAEAFWKSTALNLLAPGIASRIRRFMPRDGSRILQHALSEGVGFASANVMVHGGGVSLPQLGYDALFGFILGGVQGRVVGAAAQREACAAIEARVAGATRVERQATASKALDELKDKAFDLRQTLANATAGTALEREALLAELRKVSDAISASRRVFWSAATVERLSPLLVPVRLVGRGVRGVGSAVTGVASTLTRSAEWCMGQTARIVRSAVDMAVRAGARGTDLARAGGARLLHSTERIAQNLTARLELLSQPAAHWVRQVGGAIAGGGGRIVAIAQGSRETLSGGVRSARQWVTARWAAVQMLQAARTEARVFLQQATSGEVRAWQQSLLHSEIPAAQAQHSSQRSLASRAKVLGLRLQRLEAALHEEARGLASVTDGMNYTRVWDLFFPRSGGVSRPRTAMRSEGAAVAAARTTEAPLPKSSEPGASPNRGEPPRAGPDEHTSPELTDRYAKVRAEIGQREQYLKKVEEGLGKASSDRVREMLREEADAAKRSLADLQTKLHSIEETIAYQRAGRGEAPQTPDAHGAGGERGISNSGTPRDGKSPNGGGSALQAARRATRPQAKPGPKGAPEGGATRPAVESGGVALLDPEVRPRSQPAPRTAPPQPAQAPNPGARVAPSAPLTAPAVRPVVARSPLVHPIPAPAGAHVGVPTVVRIPTQSVMNHGDAARSEETRRRRHSTLGEGEFGEEEPRKKRGEDPARRREEDPRPRAPRPKESSSSSLRTLYLRRAKFIGEDIGATFYEQLEEAAGELFGDETQASETNLFARRRFAVREDDDGRL